MQTRSILSASIQSPIAVIQVVSEDGFCGQRAEYGKQIIVSLSQQLTQTYGRDWGEKQLRHCLHFSAIFPDEQPPLGIILCAGKKQEQVELLELGKSGIHVAEYLTVLPPKELLQAKLRDAIASARRRLPPLMEE